MPRYPSPGTNLLSDSSDSSGVGYLSHRFCQHCTGGNCKQRERMYPPLFHMLRELLFVCEFFEQCVRPTPSPAAILDHPIVIRPRCRTVRLVFDIVQKYLSTSRFVDWDATLT